MADIKLNLAHWPVLVTTTPTGMVSDEELLDFLARFRELLASKSEPYVSVLDLRDNGGLRPHQRKIITDGMKDESASYARCQGVALVFDSALLRGMLTAIFWVKPPKVETRVFTDLNEAVEWGRALMHRRKAGRVA